ncbi:GspH/FimT family pseudopilin [Azoarcus sp. KH32C]|uniref:GspH/FimT family pseudopilin n=1 Tax=Azoarcus sp. KH32C TaxID=748247 RepID=UPI0002386EFC|nr:GspH/FimT family pseudopilin [Azoarcus sp. KH32C]BAL25516.1 fimbrial protein pilin [Azoarcus sp. KH32C]
MISRTRLRGVTLIELLTAIAIMAVLVTMAAPSLNNFILKSRLKGAGEALHSDLVYARTEAVTRNQTITVSFSTGTDWCYGISTGGTCNCATAGSCSIKAVSGTSYTGTTLATSFTALTFDGVQGTIGGAGGTVGTDTVLIQNSIGQAGVRPAMVSLKLCSPSSYTAVTGYPSC